MMSSKYSFQRGLGSLAPTFANAVAASGGGAWDGAVDPGWFAGLAEQAGGNWWANNDGKWTVAINDAATKKMASYWGDLVNQGVLAGKPMYTPEWNKAMSDGTLLAWPSAIWGAGVLEGVAPSTKGKWKMVPMPQWDAGAAVTGYWGGSATAIWSKSKQQAQAEKFVKWLNTDPEALDAMVRQLIDVSQRMM